MKFLIVILAVSFSAFAKTRMPDTIVCTSNATSEAVRSFSLVDLSTTRPNATIEDTGLLGYSVQDGYLTMDLSNECDNGYTVQLMLHEIEEMVEGKRTSISGKLTYSDVALSEANNSEEAMEETVEISCRLNEGPAL